jgi:hypothetical protein
MSTPAQVARQQRSTTSANIAVADGMAALSDEVPVKRLS